MTFQGLDELNASAVNRRWSRKRTNRPNLAHVVAVFLGILCAVWLFDLEKANAMNLSLVTPDGAGVTVKIPLNNFKPVKSNTEIHFYALQNRQRMVSVETPLHGRFMRVRFAELKFVKRFKNGQPKKSRPRFKAFSNNVDSSVAKPLYRKAALELRKPAKMDNFHYPSAARNAAYAVGSLHKNTRSTTSKNSRKTHGKISLMRARQISSDYANRYSALRSQYIRLARKNPKAARRLHTKVMKLYRVAAKWQSYLKSIK